MPLRRSFEDAGKFNWEPMESLENRRCRCVFITVCDNSSKYVLHKLWFVHIETGHTPEERVAVIKTTTRKGISHQDSSLISQIHSNLPEITHLNKHVLQILRT